MLVAERIRAKFDSIDKERKRNQLWFDNIKRTFKSITECFSFQGIFDDDKLDLCYKERTVLTVELLNNKIYFSSIYTDYAICLDDQETLENAIVSHITRFYKEEV